MTGTLRDYPCAFMTVSPLILLKMRNISDKSCTENRNAHFMFNNVFRKSCSYEIMWKNMVERDRPQITLYGSCALNAG